MAPNDIKKIIGLSSVWGATTVQIFVPALAGKYFPHAGSDNGIVKVKVKVDIVFPPRGERQAAGLGCGRNNPWLSPTRGATTSRAGGNATPYRYFPRAGSEKVKWPLKRSVTVIPHVGTGNMVHIN